MNFFYVLPLILLFFGFSCSENAEKKDLKLYLSKENIQSISSNKNIKSQPCYYIKDTAKRKCDSTLIEIFGEYYFRKNIKWNGENSFINCDSGNEVVLMSFGDTNCCNPRIYDIQYDIKIGNQNIFQFRMSASSDQNFVPISKIIDGQLAAYKKLIKGEFNIDYNEAKNLAIRNGFAGKKMTIELFYNDDGNINSTSSFFWEVDEHKTDDSRKILHINPINGKVETKFIEMMIIE